MILINVILEVLKKVNLDWANTTPLKRSRILSKYKNLIEKNIDEFSKIVSSQSMENY